MQKYILEEVSDPRLKVYMVWGPMLGEETAEDAVVATAFLHDQRSIHFWTPLHDVAKLFQGPAGLPADELAWDTFQLFSPTAEWGKTPPQPVYVMHVEKSLPKELRLNGNTLRGQIETLLSSADSAGHSPAE